MSILSRFFHRRIIDGLLEFVDRVYVMQALVVFSKMFKNAHEENEHLAEVERKKLEKGAKKEQPAAHFAREDGIDLGSSKPNYRTQKHAF